MQGAEAEAKALVSSGGQRLAMLDEAIGSLRKVLDAALETRKVRKAGYRTNPRWEANALLSLAILEAERAMLVDRTRLLDAAVKEGKFKPFTGGSGDRGYYAWFNAQKKYPAHKKGKYTDAFDPIEILLQDHAGTPWAWCAERVSAWQEVLSVDQRNILRSGPGTGPVTPPPPGR